MTAGRPRGQTKSGGAQKGSVHLHSRAVKDAVYAVFHEMGGRKYLKKVAKENPPLFLSLLAKLLPTEIRAELDINAHKIDLGALIAEADARLSQMRKVEALPPAPAKTLVDENNV